MLYLIISKPDNLNYICTVAPNQILNSLVNNRPFYNLQPTPFNNIF
jgi:hypothetical protein